MHEYLSHYVKTMHKASIRLHGLNDYHLLFCCMFLDVIYSLHLSFLDSPSDEIFSIYLVSSLIVLYVIMLMKKITVVVVYQSVEYPSSFLSY